MILPSDDLNKRLHLALDRNKAIELLRQAIGRESITGNERNFVAFLEQEMQALKLEQIMVKDFLPGRPNISGVRKGLNSGKKLLFIGHTDVVHVEGWREHWAGTPREDPFGAPIIDGSIWGRGSGDLKAGICCALSALALLDQANIKLQGDVSFAFAGDEESGEVGTGVSAGVKAYVCDIEAGRVEKPDFVIYVEPTQMEVFTAQIGFFIADITLTGKSAYFGVPEQGKDALKAAHTVMSALWQHCDEIAAEGVHDLVGKGFLLITSCTSGGSIAVPEMCKLSLIRKLLPGESLDEAVKKMEFVIRNAITDPEIHLDIAYPAGRDHEFGGTAMQIDKQLPEVALLSRCVSEMLPERGQIRGAPYWSEAPFFVNQLGIPALYCAPGDISNCHTFEEHVEIEQYLAGIVSFAAFIVHYCGIEN